MNRPCRPLSSNFTYPVTSAYSVSSLPCPTLTPAWCFVPRCRTKIVPAFTSCPPKRFTPSLWPCESRPLVDDPPPFLCAMTHPSFSFPCHFEWSGPFFSCARPMRKKLDVRRVAQGGICFFSSTTYSLISLTCTAVKFCRCPREILYWLPFLNLSTVNFFARPWSTILPVTVTFDASDPRTTFLSSVCTASTEPNVTFSPTSPLTRSIRIVSPGATRYCFPPVCMTAYIAPPPVKTNPKYRGFTPTPSTHENHR